MAMSGSDDEFSDDDGELCGFTLYEMHPRWSQSDEDAGYPASGALARRTMGVAAEEAKLERQLAQLETPDLTDGTSVVNSLLGLLSSPQELYRNAGARVRNVLNQIFFTRVYLDADDKVKTPHAVSDELAEAVKPFIEVHRNPDMPVVTYNDGATVLADGSATEITPTLLLAAALANTGSSKTAMVGSPV